MPLYRCYRLNSQGQVFEPPRADEFADDDAAKSWARDMLAADTFFTAVGLWQKGRLVEVIHRPENAARAAPEDRSQG